MSAPHGPATRRNGEVSTIATLAHDQGPWLLEWVVWHRLAGFDRVVICHAADDSAVGLIVCLQDHGMAVGVTVARTDSTERARQIRSAINSPAARAALQGTDWLLVAEVTDFLHLCDKLAATTPAQTDVGHLLALCAQTDGIALPAISFGTGGHGHFANRPVTARFTHRHATRAAARLPVRVLSRYFPGWTYGLHRPTPPEGTIARWCTPNGSVTTSDTLTWFLSPEHCGGDDPVRINRYPLRSAEEYLLGRALPLTKADADEFARLNACDTFDDSAAQKPLAQAMAKAARLPGMADVLAHQQAHLHHRLSAIRSQPEFAANLRCLLPLLHRAAPCDPVWRARNET